MTYYSANPFLETIVPDVNEEDYSDVWSQHCQEYMSQLRAANRNGHKSRTGRDVRVRLHPHANHFKSHQKTAMATVQTTPWTIGLDNSQISPASSPSTSSTSPEASIGTPWTVSSLREDIIVNDVVAGMEASLWPTTLDSTQMSFDSSPSTMPTSSATLLGIPWPVSRMSEDLSVNDGVYGMSNPLYLEDNAASVNTEHEPLLSSELQMGQVAVFQQKDVGTLESPATIIPVKPFKTQGKKKNKKSSGRGKPGRPRNSPKEEPRIKKGNARTKTGCTTCRRRKKKCDEAKPICTACRRIGHECEFPPPQSFKNSNKKKREGSIESSTGIVLETSSDSDRTPTVTLQTIKLKDTNDDLRQESEPILSLLSPLPAIPRLFPGEETAADRILLIHCYNHLSCLWFDVPEQDDAFRRLAVEAALQDRGTMHSMLAFAGQHINYNSQDAKDLLQEFPNVTIGELERCTQHHIHKAQTTLQDRINTPEKYKNLTAAKLQLIFGLFSTLNKPVDRREHRTILSLYQGLCTFASEKAETSALENLMTDIINYHIFADRLISLPNANILSSKERDPTLITTSRMVNLMGMTEGVFVQLSKITQLRNRIRNNMYAGPAQSRWKYQEQHEAASIDRAIDKRRPAWPIASPYEVLKPLYNLMALIYLYRTMRLPEETNWIPDADLIRCVDEAIKLVRLVDPSSGLQTFLLLPVFIIGCAAFEHRHRQGVHAAIQAIKTCRGFKNADTTLAVVEQVWKLMDAKDPTSWDWEYIAHRMGLDYLPV